MIRILKALEADGTPDIHEIREIVGLSISRTRELVKRAVERGLVEGTPDVDDIMCYDLTDAGYDALAEAAEMEYDAPTEATEAGDQDDAEGLPAILEEPAEEPEAPAKAKRVILNPQPVIDKKTALLAEAGFTLTYASRTWTIQNKETGRSFSFDSQALAAVKTAQIVEYAKWGVEAEKQTAA